MSGFSFVSSSPARRGVPTFCTGAPINPDSLFRASEGGDGGTPVPGFGSEFRVKKVKVEIFDLSDIDQRKAYESLWKRLLVKVGRLEAVVETSKDLVRRPDGTSYWMKYVEYVEFAGEGDSPSKGDETDEGCEFDEGDECDEGDGDD